MTSSRKSGYLIPAIDGTLIPVTREEYEKAYQKGFKMSAKVDMVNHPPHYMKHPVFRGECIYYTAGMYFEQGNAFKYLWRCEKKGSYRHDIEKAVWYLNSFRIMPNKRTQAINPEILKSMREDIRDYTNKEDYDPDVALMAHLMLAIAEGV